MSDYDAIMRYTWIGVATKIGGGLIAAGVESTTGIMFNALNPNWARPFTIESIRLQLGLGGGIGVSVVMVFNCSSIFSISGTDVNDWGVNFTLGPNWTAVVKNLTRLGFFGKAMKVKGLLKSANSVEAMKDAKIISKLTPSDMEGLKNGVNYFWNANDLAKRGSDTVISALDVPGAGVGAEIAVCPIIKGKFNVLPW